MSHGAGLQLRPDQDEQSNDAEHQSSFAASGNVVIAEEQGIEHQKPQRGDGDDQRSEARRNGKFRIGQREVAAHQQQQADHCSQRDLARRIENPAPGRGAHRQHHTPAIEKRTAHMSAGGMVWTAMSMPR